MKLHPIRWFRRRHTLPPAGPTARQLEHLLTADLKAGLDRLNAAVKTRKENG